MEEILLLQDLATTTDDPYVRSVMRDAADWGLRLHSEMIYLLDRIRTVPQNENDSAHLDRIHRLLKGTG